MGIPFKLKISIWVQDHRTHYWNWGDLPWTLLATFYVHLQLSAHAVVFHGLRNVKVVEHNLFSGRFIPPAPCTTKWIIEKLHKNRITQLCCMSILQCVSRLPWVKSCFTSECQALCIMQSSLTLFLFFLKQVPGSKVYAIQGALHWDAIYCHCENAQRWSLRRKILQFHSLEAHCKHCMLQQLYNNSYCL